VIYTHSHADHVHGIDDLRMIVFNRRSRLEVWADAPTQDALINRFEYAFVQPVGSTYPPILNLNTIDGDTTIDGLGGPVVFEAFKVNHGGMDALGFKVNKVAYLPDVADIPAQSWGILKNLEVWIVDALRREPHPTHSHLDNTLEWIAQAKPKRAILTNMHIDLDYETIMAETPNHVEPAYDGLKFCIPTD
jgi:phosphoribosyl 1,2-cyclic phosphate phosphodiesterase